MQNVATDKTAFDRPYDPISASGMLRHAVDTDAVFNDMLNGIQPFDRMLASASTELAITAGVLAAPTLIAHTVAAQTGTSDDLDTIPARNNTYLFLKAKAGHTIALRHGTGNLSSSGGIDVSMSGNKMVMLVCEGGQWGIVGTNRPNVNITATTDPGSTSDAQAGYSVGSMWINTVLDRAWECIDSTSGNALWKIVSPWKNGFAFNSTPNGGTSIGTGIGAINASGGSNDNNNIFGQVTSTGVGVERSGWADSHDSVRPAFNPWMEWIVKTGTNLTTLKIWFGVASAAIATDVDTLPAATKFIGFRFSTSAADTGWRPVLNDGTTQNTGTAIGTVAASTVYKLRIRIDANLTTAYFSVNDGAETALSTNFPAIASDMGIDSVIVTNAVARSIQLSKIEVGW